MKPRRHPLQAKIWCVAPIAACICRKVKVSPRKTNFSVATSIDACICRRREPQEIQSPKYSIYDLACPAREALGTLIQLNLTDSDGSILTEAEFDPSGELHKIEFSWEKPGNKRHKNWSNTILGHLRIEGSNRTTEVNSIQAARAKTQGNHGRITARQSALQNHRDRIAASRARPFKKRRALACVFPTRVGMNRKRNGYSILPGL